MTAASSELGQREPSLDDRPVLGSRGAMIGLVVAAGVIDFLIFPLVRVCEDAPGMMAIMLVMPLVFGFIPGQFGAMAVWLIWGQGPFLRRLIVHWGVVMGLGAAFLLGLAAASMDQMSPSAPGDVANALRAVAMVACSLPAISLGAQLPLWPLRTYFGWRIEQPGGEASRGGQPLTLLDIFSGTAVAGVTFGLARAMIGLSPTSEFLPPSFVWIQLATTAGVSFGLSLLLGIPVVIGALWTRSPSVGIGSLCGYLLVALLLLLGIPSIFSGTGPDIVTVVIMLLGTFTLAATLAAPLLVLRACGYRLTWPRDRRLLT
jgi:hypothetical protein